MPKISLANGFLRLPPEISIQILLELRWNELLVAQRVCRAFKALIESSKLQYHIHLAIAGYEDELGSHPMPMLERLRTLKATQRCFSRMDFPNSYRIELEEYTPTYELQGGVFLQGRHPSHSWDQTIGVNAWNFQDPVKPFAWRLPDLNRPIRDLTLDPSQDLLVLIEGAHW
jgi:F-box-like